MQAQPRQEEDQSPRQSADRVPADHPWHRFDEEQALRELASSRDGLSDEEANRRLETHGPNRIGRRRTVSAWQVLVHQFTSPLIYVLLGALVVVVATSLLTGDDRWGDAIVIGIVLVVNATIGFFQEYRAEHAVEELMKMVAPKAAVRRGGKPQTVEAASLVPGDVVEVGEGNVIPADLRLIEVHSLQVNEAALTGESVPVDKSDQAMADADDDLRPADRRNMSFMGTAVTAGNATGVVVTTGHDTEIGKIAEQVEEAGETQTPLQRRIQQLARWITWGILVVAAIAMVVGVLLGQDWSRMITLAVALAVAAIPAGLPIVVTVALAIGVRRMAEHHAVIRHLPAVDTLGSCTTIVSDKTGTLTQNRMTVRAILAGDARYDVAGSEGAGGGRLERNGEAVEADADRALYETLLVGALCNDARLPDEGGGGNDESSGDPMEVALRYAACQGDLDRAQLEREYPRIDQVPFKTERRFMATIHEVKAQEQGPNGPLVAVKGAPEAVVAMCDDRRNGGGGQSRFDPDAVIEASDELAGEGLRVLAMAVGWGDEAARLVREDERPEGFTFVGLQGLLDPPRSSAVEAVDQCHGAGIRVIMVTGDHARTASAIAREVHIGRPDDEHSELPEACTGSDIRDLGDEDLDRRLEHTNVFARVEPAQKTRLVERLKAARQIVAVTGDGVNDAPALKAADIGAAMGSGTDVAKEASDMVITDDNFASVYRAVEQGRTAFRNIRMATFFLLSTGAAMVLVILSALGLRWPLPLLPAQILWCNVVTNGIADVALAFEPGEKALYSRPPRPPSEGVLDRILLERLVLVGVWLAIGTLGMFLWKWGFDFSTWESGSDDNLTVARTAALTTMVLFQKVHVFNCRSEDVSLFGKSLLSNKVLFLGVLASLAVHAGAVYLPWTQNLLSLAPLDLGTWVWAAAIASTAIIVNEAHKWLRPQYR